MKLQSDAVEFRHLISDDVPNVIIGDSHRLAQVLLNLTSNALKFTQNGFVELRVECRATAGGLVTLRFSVEDTGEGIPLEARASIMNAFAQAEASTTRTHGGTGLGLSISSMLVEAMGGSLGVQSEAGRGSTFSFEASFEKAPDDSVPEAPCEEVFTKPIAGGKVLVVDDNKVNRMVCSKMLEQMGCTVVIAENGVKAIEKWKAERPELVLMDWQMPVMDGLTAARKIRECESAGERVPIVAFTASVLKDDQVACRDAGMDDILAKPVRKDALRACFLRWLN